MPDHQTPPGVPEDDDPITASERTRRLIHEIAIGLTRLGNRAEALKEDVRSSKAAQRAAEAADEAKEAARQAARFAEGTARHASEAVRARSGAAAGRTQENLATARARAQDLLDKAEHAAEHTAERLEEMTEELGARARRAKETGKDFFVEHREEILALLLTAAKVAAVVGIRRLTAPREEDEAPGTKAGRQKTAKRFIDATAVLAAVMGHLGHLLAKQPSALPMLREMYARGEPTEQAVVGVLLGPALSSDPDHAVEVVHEFLEGATSGGAADAIARRTLAPLLEKNPELVERVTPWFRAAAPYVRRAALLALARYVKDRESRVGDIVAAAVVVLEDHDEDVRQALVKLFSSSGDVDPEATARVLADRLDSEDATTRADAQRLVDALPQALQDHVEAARTDRET